MSPSAQMHLWYDYINDFFLDAWYDDASIEEAMSSYERTCRRFYDKSLTAVYKDLYC